MSKIQKNRKNVRKIVFFLMLCGVFFNIFALHTMLTTLHLFHQNKNLKNSRKKLLKLFFKNEKWTFIFVHFLKFKKSFKKIKFLNIYFREMELNN
jgi:Na+/melibiose symporter-like transporter